MYIGDFNLPSINWKYMTTDKDIDNIIYKFIEKLRDCCLTQFVDTVIRCRGTDKASLLDLVISNDEDLVTQIDALQPLGKSDHCCLFITRDFGM